MALGSEQNNKITDAINSMDPCVISIMVMALFIKRPWRHLHCDNNVIMTRAANVQH